MLDEPFECEAPLVEIGVLAATDFALAFAFDVFVAFGRAFALVLAFAFDAGLAGDDFARLGADRFFALVFV
ncbi:MAG TPA: hypothetical protein VLK37_01330 [Solirubrobacterales bacterium]|nr:hypothetical protein [Solirubrobacterales bacterium]